MSSSARERPCEPPSGVEGSGDALPRLGEDGSEDSDDLGELLLAGDERWRDLDDRVLAVVGAADEPVLEERLGQEPAQEGLALVRAERLAGRLVLHELDRPQEARAAHV